MSPTITEAAKLAKLILDYETAADGTPEKAAALQALEAEIWTLIKVALARIAGLSTPPT